MARREEYAAFVAGADASMAALREHLAGRLGMAFSETMAGVDVYIVHPSRAVVFVELVAQHGCGIGSLEDFVGWINSL